MSLDDIVNVTITAATTVPTRVGFGIPCILAQHTHFSERARIYTSLAGMATDGFAVTEPAYLAVQAVFAQNPKPNSVVVGRAINESPKKVNYIPVMPLVAAVTVYTIYINGVAGTFTSDASPTVLEVCAGLKSAIDALGGGVTVVDNATSIDITATTVAQVFTDYSNDRTLFIRKDITPNSVSTGVVGDITAVRAANDDWYALILTDLGLDVISAAAAHIETLTKIMVVASADDACYNGSSTTDILYVAEAGTYARSSVTYHPKAAYQFPHAGWVGKCLPKDPGKITWNFKALAGITVTYLTPTEIAAIEAKKGNHYTRVAGVSITQQGVMSSGTFIDLTHSMDFMKARLQEYIYAKLVNTDKIPYTDAGVAVIEAEIRAVLKLCITQGILAASPAPTVTIPKVVDQATTNRALRYMPDITFTATTAGAIHSLAITGTLSV